VPRNPGFTAAGLWNPEKTFVAKPVSRALIIPIAAAALLGAASAWAATQSETTTQDTPAVQKVTQAVSYVMVDPIYASILDGALPRGLLLVEISLDVPDEGLRAQVNRSLPLLRDAYVRNMLVYAANAVRPWKQPSVEDIATRLQATTDQVMGREGARVLMAQLAIRVTR
jgi:flagellar basal body-associated protein FliL